MSRGYKICLLGEGRVGKTSLLLRFVRGQFDDKQASTLSASCFEKVVQGTRLAIWDTAGQERFHALGPLYYRDSEAALLVYDITDVNSFARVKEWVKELRKMLGDDIVIGVAGNKCDCEKDRNVDKTEALAYTSSIGGVHFLTSAKTGAGVEDAFTELLKRAVAKRKVRDAGAPESSSGRNKLIIVDDEPEEKKKSGCCG